MSHAAASRLDFEPISSVQRFDDANK